MTGSARGGQGGGGDDTTYYTDFIPEGYKIDGSVRTGGGGGGAASYGYGTNAGGAANDKVDPVIEPSYSGYGGTGVVFIRFKKWKNDMSPYTGTAGFAIPNNRPLLKNVNIIKL